MKIGIMTFHASLNCGSMLQAYALQHILETEYNADVEIINYSNAGQRNYYSLWDWYPRPKVIKANFKVFPYHNVMKRVRADYEHFSKKYLNANGKLLKHRCQLNGIDKKYDIVIAGGDQVWNVRCRDADKAYFLSFVKSAKKVAYSPSLGARNINKVALNPKAYAKLINDFEFLSVRENNGQKWIKDLIGTEVPIIADPTLLMTRKEWMDSISLKDIKEDFILYYAFSYENEYNNKVMQKVIEKTGLPIYTIDGKSWAVNRLDQYGIKLWKQSGPKAFLELLNSAKLVFVQSFHGIIFSALFHKKFWSLRNKIIKNLDDDRARVILHQTGLESRAITFEELLTRDLMEEVNYTTVDENIEKMRARAFEYISEFMKE